MLQVVSGSRKKVVNRVGISTNSQNTGEVNGYYRRPDNSTLEALHLEKIQFILQPDGSKKGTIGQITVPSSSETAPTTPAPTTAPAPTPTQPR